MAKRRSPSRSSTKDCEPRSLRGFMDRSYGAGGGLRAGGRGSLGELESRNFFRGQKTLGLHDRDNILIQCRDSAIPIAFFVAKCLRKSLESRHGGHFFYAVDEQGCARAAK